MVTLESVITAGIGAILGTVLGIVFSLIVSRPLADEGFGSCSRSASLIVFFVLAGDRGRRRLDPARPPRVEGRRAAGGDHRISG